MLYCNITDKIPVLFYREIALEILMQQEIGSFIVRDSTTHPGCYALSVKVPKFENPAGISHYLIHRTSSGGVKLKVNLDHYSLQHCLSLSSITSSNLSLSARLFQPARLSLNAVNCTLSNETGLLYRCPGFLPFVPL